ncbi:hypothetical protein [Spiroplasma turonicum]|uniref:Transmembrane protein n=1 Tax=Spiroplasma turonicum TaxID=216946 RepID=A0A0K1P6R8_9MOLU|nr:hypothetical protein [Spiroplasma turonicum]AKU79996.1 hypothetical protein STURON_00750 [Spiroplasma turonicum]ALX70998.1 hypothetical protein STURO_v1c07470 [Spiroplasma turonicum]
MKINGLCKGGAIVVIVISSIVILYGSLNAISAMAIESTIEKMKEDYKNNEEQFEKFATYTRMMARISLGICISFVILALLNIILSSLLLSGKVKVRIWAGVFGLFTSLLVGGILILVGKAETKTIDEMANKNNEPITPIFENDSNVNNSSNYDL